MAQYWLGVPDERGFLRRVKNGWLPLFPRLVSQGQFNRRARSLAPCQLIDGTPVHLRH